MTTLTRVVHGFELLEAARWVPGTGLVFSDMLAGGVYTLAAGATRPEVLIPHRKAIGGLAPHAGGGYVVSGRNVTHKGPAGDAVLLETASDEQFFNDLAADGRGRVFAGSMPLRDPDGTPLGAGRLYQIGLDGAVAVIADDVLIANGMAPSPADDLLYQVDSGRALVWRFRLDDGPATAREAFVDTSEYDGVPDGLAVASDGSVWVAMAGGGLVVGWAADGSRITEIAVPNPLVTTVCFGGDDLGTLFILTGSNHDHPHPDGGEIFTLPAPVKGLPCPTARVVFNSNVD